MIYNINPPPSSFQNTGGHQVMARSSLQGCWRVAGVGGSLEPEIYTQNHGGEGVMLIGEYIAHVFLGDYGKLL